MAEIRIEIPCVPPSGNHYKTFRSVPNGKGGSVPSWYLTKEAKAWYRDIAILARGEKIRGTPVADGKVAAANG